MRYDSEQMTFVGIATTVKEADALRLHYEIMAAAQAAAASLLDLARKIKLMRDTGGYKALGFDTLEAYTLATMGMKQRQAYNYIAIAEKLPAQLIEQNAAAGVTKLALLAQLSGQEQQQIAAETNLTETTVAALKAQIKELQAKNAGYAEQLSLLQNQPPVAEAQAEEVDMDALRAEIRAEMKAETESQRQADAKMTELNQKERDEAIKAAQKARAEHSGRRSTRPCWPWQMKRMRCKNDGSIRRGRAAGYFPAGRGGWPDWRTDHRAGNYSFYCMGCRMLKA